MRKASTCVNIFPMNPCAPGDPCCPPLSRAALSLRDATSLAVRLRVLADPARLRLLALIRGQPSGEACVCHLVAPLRLSQPTVTHHLQVLHRAGFLSRERRGVWVYYRAVPRTLATLRAALS